MSLILVIEQDGAYTERIRGALTAEGWTVRVVGDHDSALAAARQTSPDLVVVSTATRRAADLFRAFGRRHGGPGAFALTEPGQTAAVDADGSVAKPFTDEQLRMGLRRCLSRVQRAAAEAAAAQAASAGEQLTSQDLFGDLLAEVEAEVTRSAPPPRAAARGDDMERKLEQTLSGVMRIPGAKPSVPAAPPPAAPREATPSASAPAASAPPAAPPGVPMSPAAQAPAAPIAAAPAPPTPPTAAPFAAAAAPTVPQPPPPTRAADAAPRTAATARQRTDAAVDDLLSQTLSGLGVSRPKAKPAAPAPAGAPPHAAAPVAAAAPSAPTEAPREEPPRQEPPRQEPPAPERAPEPPRREPEPPAPAYREPPPSKPSKKADKRGRREAAGDVFAPPPPLPTPAAAAAASPVATTRVEGARDQVPRDVPFGQYTLLERVAIGGMAEVWKARMRGVEGFQKTVAIKKILAHLTDSVDFVTMFIDEAKLAAQLNHPHIIHIYDLGKIDEDYYIAMEYVEGKDLRSILNTARREGTPMPLGLALLVASRLASALDYAHRKRDFDNRELGLVHRDVSPQNVLISYEGDIKLCDFGIAKAVAKASKTQMGALKGKLQYMSPEQAWGRVVDSRSDVFSLGAVLFEMLTGRRLFAGESEISVLESVREARTQSVRDVNPAIPEPVDAIVRRALAKDPDDRFQTAGEMQKEIDAVLHSLRAGASQGDLAAFMHRLHAGEVAALSVAGTVAAAAPAPEAAWGEREVPAVVPIGEPAEPEARRRPWLIPAAAAAAALVALAVFVLTRGPSGANVGAEPAATVDAAPPGAPQAVAAQPLPAAVEAVPPGAGAVPAAAPAGAELQQRVEDQLRAKEQQLEQQLEAQRRELQAELQREAPAQPAPAPAVAEAEPVETPAAAAPPPPPPPAETPVVVEERPAPRPPPRPAPALQEEPARPTVSEGDLVAAGTPGLSPPGFVSFTKPEYPPLAKRLAVEGTVVIGVLVDESGQVQEARLVRGVSQNVGLNEAALRAARTARYRPATMTGVRVKTWVNLTIPFKL